MLRRIRTNLLVLGGYCTISFLCFGLPLWSHPGRYLVGTPGQRDPEIYVWSFAWWPHAIASWTNPFFTHVIYVPHGVNLTWATSVPGLALAFSPITALFGPTVSYNVAALLLPALAAWTCFLLCRSVTRSIWASLVGGYLFGFSSYVLGHQLAGHLQATGILLIPLVALVLVRYTREELSGRGLMWRLGVLVALQISISSEVALTLTIVLALALALAFALLPDMRRRLVSSLAPVAGGFALAALLALPLVYYTLSGLAPASLANLSSYSGDLLNFALPTRLVAAGGSALTSVTAHFAGNDNERDSYLGIPALVIVALFALRARSSAPARFLLASLVVVAVLTLGTALHVNGHRIVALPWSVPAHWPAFNDVLPARFAMYASLVTAVIVAVWIASLRASAFVRVYVLPLLAVAALIPAVWQVDFHQLPERWAFFTDGLYKSCVPPGETLAIFPFGRWGDSMLWQAESDFGFRMAEGNMVRDQGESFFTDPTVSELEFKFIDETVRPSMTQLVAFAKRHRVDRVASVVIHAYPNGTQMHAFGSLQSLGGVLVSPACGYTSLTGDRRMVPPGQHDLGGRAAITVVLDSRKSLRRASALLAHANGAVAAGRLLSQTSSTLQLVESYDPTASTLKNAAESVGRAHSALSASARPGREAVHAANELIRRGNAALGAYIAAINPGVEP